VVLCKTSDVDGDSVTETKLHNYLLSKSVRLDDNGFQVTIPITYTDTDAISSYGLWTVQGEVHPEMNQLTGLSLIKIPLTLKNSFVEKSNYNCLMSRNIKNYNNPELVFTFDSATTDAMYADIYADIHNLLEWVQGDFKQFLA
jgi:hypothetical protein